MPGQDGATLGHIPLAKVLSERVERGAVIQEFAPGGCIVRFATDILPAQTSTEARINLTWRWVTSSAVCAIKDHPAGISWNCNRL